MIDLPSGYVLASRKRLVLSLYLDYLIFCVPWGLASWVLFRLGMLDGDIGLGPKAIGFLIIEALLVRQMKWSPGNMILGIKIHRPTDLEEASQESIAGRLFLVRAALLNSERWWTMLLGVLLIQDGSKSLIRWTMYVPPLPFFGTQLNEVSSALVMLALGCAAWFVGIGVLRMNLISLPAGLAYYATTATSFLLSKALLPGWIERYVVARRAFQGLPVRDGEIEVMQRFIPYAFVGAPVLLALWLLLFGLRVIKVRGANSAADLDRYRA